MNNDPATIYRELWAISRQGGSDPTGREARLRAAVRAYEDARIDGLCHEGAWELALEAMRGPAAGTYSSTNDITRPDAGRLLTD